ncbi:MAG: phenylalanine--tRNA ligase beta subunit-related protein [Candidatus Bathyarchaeota archaeon]|nr:phenylalanine--tRNA ligase beta subunit-related protein [Candidatus Bathyarchaeota archaeon]
MMLRIDSELGARFPELSALLLDIDGVNIHKKDAELEKFKEEIATQTRNESDIESVKDEPIFRAYRDFFWTIGIDPTKTRPASEALTRRVLAGKKLPTINTLVDAYNLASIKSKIAIATFDKDKLEGELFMRFAKPDEQIVGIGMEKPLVLKGGEIVLFDSVKLVAVYPYRDADNTKVTEKTKNVTLVLCGVPGIQKDALEVALDTAREFVTRFCVTKTGSNIG